MGHVHIIGAGLAGLSAAVDLTAAGRTVTVYEAGPAAGGRCRSYFDKELGIRIDNGNHLLLSGNKATFRYLKAIGATDRLTGPKAALFPFISVQSGSRWTLRPNRGRLPWWILFPHRRMPGTRVSDYLALARIAKITSDIPVADVIRRGRIYWLLAEPLAIAALNTRPQVGLARLLGAVLRETLLAGGKACLPRFPREGLSEALVDPAIETLRGRGAQVQFGRRVTALTIQAQRITGLEIGTDTIPVGPDDSVVLAVPPWIAGELLPNLETPNEFEAILNIHFRLKAHPPDAIEKAGFTGLIGGAAEWVFVKSDHVSVTISAANARVDESATAIATSVWPNVCAALDVPEEERAAMPPFRVVKERRATFAATAKQEKRRPGVQTEIANLALAGDWTATGLPATIEGAIRSGQSAARFLLAGEPGETNETHDARQSDSILFRSGDGRT